MKCGEARKHLYLVGQADSERPAFPIQAEAEEAQAHVAHCDACREFFAAEQRLKDFVLTRAPREKVLASLRERVLAEISRERGQTAKSARWFGRISRRSLLIASAGLLLVALAGGLWLSWHGRVDAQPIAAVLIEDHAHSLPAGAEITSSNHNVVQSWFDGKVEFSFHLPPASDQSLIGGRLCNLRGRQAALIFYQHPQSRVSLFVFDGGDIVLPEDRLISLDGKRCLIDSQKGYNAVLWKERGVLYGLVSDARSADLLQLAAQF